MSQPQPVPAAVLIVLDGWGLAEPGPGNAVELAETPVFDQLWDRFPHATLRTSGRDVGLPDGQMGNSEVGHLNLGAGAIVNQDLTRIDIAIEQGTLASNAALQQAFAVSRSSGRLHLMGLVSDGGVHSSIDHLEALLKLADAAGVPDVVVHAFTDGRDTLPRSADGFIARLQDALTSNARVGSVIGRYFAMDRDRRWDRVKLAWDAIVHGRSEVPAASSALAAVEAAYERGENDEFIQPTVLEGPRQPCAAAMLWSVSTSAPTACASWCRRWENRISNPTSTRASTAASAPSSLRSSA